jgi:general secretion pathway protein K
MTRAHRQRGVVLIFALWTIALLSALALATSATFRGFGRLVSLSQDKVKADALLSAGLEKAAAVLAGFGDHWPVAFESFDIRLETGAAHVTLNDAAGRIDINRAPSEVLTSMLEYAGAENAETLAKAIATWRDHDAAAPAPGAAGAQPVSQPGSSQKPASFTDVGQLAEVPGFTPEVIATIGSLTTVYGAEKVNALTASPEVLAALPGLKGANIAALLRARETTPVNEAQIASAAAGATGALELRKGRSAALVEITASLVDGYRQSLRAAIIVLSHDSAPYRVLAWTPVRNGSVLTEAATPAEP